MRPWAFCAKSSQILPMPNSFGRSTRPTRHHLRSPRRMKHITWALTRVEPCPVLVGTHPSPSSTTALCSVGDRTWSDRRLCLAHIKSSLLAHRTQCRTVPYWTLPRIPCVSSVKKGTTVVCCSTTSWKCSTPRTVLLRWLPTSLRPLPGSVWTGCMQPIRTCSSSTRPMPRDEAKRWLSVPWHQPCPRAWTVWPKVLWQLFRCEYQTTTVLFFRIRRQCLAAQL